MELGCAAHIWIGGFQKSNFLLESINMHVRLIGYSNLPTGKYGWINILTPSVTGSAKLKAHEQALCSHKKNKKQFKPNISGGN